MIGKLTGIIDTTDKNSIILDVSGVGYQVYTSPRTLSRIGNAGDRASLLIHTHVREDMIQLYGFCDVAEQAWFNMLTSVQGVGNKVSLAIMGACPPERLGLIIASQDKAALTQAEGVGPKLASRILTELKDKAGDIALGSGATVTAAESGEAAPKKGAKKKISGKNDNMAATAEVDDTARNALMADAVSALINLGYSRSDAYSAVSKVLSEHKDTNDISGLIALGLKELAA